MKKNNIKTWLVSDTHFGHDNIYTFTDRRTGELIRPWASNAIDGDAIMVEIWNERVKPHDRVYHLGDVAQPRRGLKIMEQLNGRKILIRGNHDIFKLEDYAKYFDDIVGTHKLDNLVLTHYPIHPDEIPPWCPGIVHGHLHSNLIRTEDDSPDSRYLNVCVEHTDKGPIEFDEVKAHFDKL